MNDSTPKQLRFPPIAGLSIRGNFDGGALSSDFGPILLRGIDQQIGLTQRLAAAFDDQRHASYIQHDLRDLFAQRIYQVACAYEDGNDANSLRHDPMFKLGLDKTDITLCIIFPPNANKKPQNKSGGCHQLGLFKLQNLPRNLL